MPEEFKSFFEKEESDRESGVFSEEALDDDLELSRELEDLPI